MTKLDRATIDEFLRRLRDAGRNAPMVRKVRVSLSSVIAHAQDLGKVGKNVLREQRRRSNGHGQPKEIVMPTKPELRTMLGADGPLWFRCFLAIAML